MTSVSLFLNFFSYVLVQIFTYHFHCTCLIINKLYGTGNNSVFV